MIQKSYMPTLGYLSPAPRVSTRHDAEASGPRAHVLGVIDGFKAHGWDVREFIIGDRVPLKWTGKGSESAVSGGVLRTLAVDFLRLGMGIVNSLRSWSVLGLDVDWVYERFAVMQSFGHKFKRHGIPWILETNALYFNEASRDRGSLVLTKLARRLELTAYRSCDVLICVSDVLKEMILDEARISPEKVLVVPNGVDIHRFSPENTRPIRLFDGVTIGFVGHLYEWQGLDLLIYALSELLKREEINLNVVVVGDGQMRSEWEQLSSNLGLTSRIKFVGSVPWEKVPNYIAGFDIGYSYKTIKYSRASYFSPLKMYEYMAMAKPVLGSDDENTKNVITDKETGIIFKGGDKEELKIALKLIYEKRASLSLMGEKARQETISFHSWEARVNRIISEVSSILDNS